MNILYASVEHSVEQNDPLASHDHTDKVVILLARGRQSKMIDLISQRLSQENVPVPRRKWPALGYQSHRLVLGNHYTTSHRIENYHGTLSRRVAVSYRMAKGRIA